MNGTAAASPFAYSPEPHKRRHGPAGYADPSSFKPWLRDDFSFRCAFCLMREHWFPANLGAGALAVEHLLPRSLYPELACAYANLAYACSACNSYKGLQTVPDPCQEAYGRHLRVSGDGTVQALSGQGTELVRMFFLNREDMVSFRKDLFLLMRAAQLEPQSEIAGLVRKMLSYPDDLPDLASLRPPGGNSRPECVMNCFFALRQHGELPETY